MERRLAAILAADVVGYSRLMEADEAGTLEAIKALRNDVIDPLIAEHRGRIVKLMGDGALVEFASAMDAVECAVDIQRDLTEQDANEPRDRHIELRIGINLGDVIVEGDDIYGEGVNVASRLEGIAEPSGVCISEKVHQEVEKKLDLEFAYLGELQVKNIEKPVRTYAAVLGDKPPVAPKASKSRLITQGQLFAATVIAMALIGSGVVAWLNPWAPDVQPVSLESIAFPLPDKPSIAVLPFANLSGDPEQDYFVDGFTNSIITNLSKFPELFIIASNSVFTYKNKAVRIKHVGQELGVRYVLEGNIQRSGEQVGIHAQLIDATTEAHIWAKEFEVVAGEILGAQGTLTQQIVGTLAARLLDLERTAALRQDLATPEAYDLYLKAQKIYEKLTKPAYEESARLLEQAIAIDPDFAEAYSELSWSYLSLWRHGLADDPEEALKRARQYAEKALELDYHDYRSHWAMGTLYLFADRDHELALAEYEKAIAANPNRANLLAMMSLLMSFMGLGEEAVAWIKKANRLNPLHPPWYEWNAALAYYMMSDYDAALLAAKETVATYRSSVSAHRMLAAIYAEMGRINEAEKVAQKIIELDPEFRLSKIRNTPFQHTSDLDRYYTALRNASLPE
jgi:class 3 adenylate cyclase/TolB-like protein/Tfp pilus assembly protein PilF